MDLSTRARVATAALGLATFGFNPHQRRGPDGRWIKMGGKGSAGPSRKAGERVSDRDSEVAPVRSSAPEAVSAAPPRNTRMDELDRRIADNEQLVNEPGEEYLADRRRAELEIQKKARASYGDPLPGETKAEHEARVFSGIKAAVAVVDDAKAAGWLTRVTHQTDNSGMPFVTVEVGNPDTHETFTMSWHTRKNGTYQLFGRPIVTRVADGGAHESGRSYGSERTPTKLREVMAQNPTAGAPESKPAEAGPRTPEVGPDGKYAKPVKQYATWNGQTETRTSRNPYGYASVVQYGGDREPVIASWHRTRAAAEKGTLTKDQRDNGVRVVGVAEVTTNPSNTELIEVGNAADQRRLEAAARRRRPTASDLGIGERNPAVTAADADVFAMPDDLADYWIRGEGAAKIRWCTEGSFERARRALREHVPAPMLDGTVANLFHRACGKWPGQDHD